MFKIGKSNSYFWPVSVSYPVDGGRIETEKFDVEFKRLGHDRIKEIQSGIEEGTIDEDALVKEVVIGWKGIVDGESEVPYSLGVLDQLIKVEGFSIGVSRAFFNSLTDGKRKN